MSNNSIPAMPIMFDNINSRLRDDLKENITKHSKLRIAAACFSIYAYEELKANLEKIEYKAYPNPAHNPINKPFALR